MATIKKMRENEKKRQLLTRLLGSFAVTAVVVVTVVVANQNPVTADFLNVQAVGNEIVYRVDVQDPDQRIAENTLQLEIKGGTEKYFVPLAIGETFGSQNIFSSSGLFQLLISANLGFGRETLDSENVEITGELSGAIFDCYVDPSINLGDNPDVLRYFVDTKYYDPGSQVASAFLEYAYVSDYPQPAKYDPDTLYYESIPITEPIQTVILENVSNYNTQMHLRLVVYLTGQTDPTILDQYGFKTPFRFVASLYDDDVGMDYAVFSVYVSSVTDLAMNLWLDVYFENQVVASLPVTLKQGGEPYSENLVRVDHLMPNAPHSAVLRAEYIDPSTGKETASQTEPLLFTTAPMYNWQITSFTETETTYEVTVQTNDPQAIITSISYTIETVDNEGIITGYYSDDFTKQGTGPMGVYTASITKPVGTSYNVEILLNKSFASKYYTEIIYTLSV